MQISAIIMTPSVFGGESCSVLSSPSIQVTPVMFTNLVASHQLTRKNIRNKSSYYMHMHMHTHIYISKIKINPIKSHYLHISYHINSMKSPCFPRFFPCFTVQKKPTVFLNLVPGARPEQGTSRRCKKPQLALMSWERRWGNGDLTLINGDLMLI